MALLKGWKFVKTSLVVLSCWQVGLYCLSFHAPFLRTDKWAETELGTKWGDKWEEKFFAGIGSRQGETWHVSPVGDSMSTFYLIELIFTFQKDLGAKTQKPITSFSWWKLSCEKKFPKSLILSFKLTNHPILFLVFFS